MTARARKGPRKKGELAGWAGYEQISGALQVVVFVENGANVAQTASSRDKAKHPDTRNYMPVCVSLADSTLVKKTKTRLERLGALHRRRITCCDGVYTVYTTYTTAEAALEGLAGIACGLGHFADEDAPTLRGVAVACLGDAVATVDISAVPKKWTVYGPLVLFGAGAFSGDGWRAFLSERGEGFFAALLEAAVAAKVFPRSVTHLAANRPIPEDDVIRRPVDLEPLHGDFGPAPTEKTVVGPTLADFAAAFWCTTVQNGIFQTWSPRYTMFSRGNIKEKKRVLDSFKNVAGAVVVDFYGGIGYFTFSYLKNGATVLAWELNPWSVEGMVRGAKANGVSYRVYRRGETLSRAEFESLRAQGVCLFAFLEDNQCSVERLRTLGPLPVRHMNMGLLPTLEPVWPVAAEILQLLSSEQRTDLHVHMNVHVDDIDNVGKKIESAYAGMDLTAVVGHAERVKTFAPDVWHMVYDVGLRKGP